MTYLLVLTIGLIAGTISGIVGFGSSIMLMPVLVLVFGPREAVPIMAIAATLANLSRVAVWWREIQWRIVGVYALTAVPGAALGARSLLVLPAHIVEVALAAFFIAMIPIRRWLAVRKLKLTLWHLAVVGAIIGYLTGIVVSTGPINAPAFLAYGLVKGSFLGTEAMSSLTIYVTKTLVFRSYGALPETAIVQGVIIGGSLTAGSVIAKRFVRRMDAEKFHLVMDALLLASGLTMLYAAII
jgi:uncharacterized membrane protein YfcA